MEVACDLKEWESERDIELHIDVLLHTILFNSGSQRKQWNVICVCAHRFY